MVLCIIYLLFVRRCIFKGRVAALHVCVHGSCNVNAFVVATIFDATFHISLRAAYALSVCLLFKSFFSLPLSLFADVYFGALIRIT